MKICSTEQITAQHQTIEYTLHMHIGLYCGQRKNSFNFIRPHVWLRKKFDFHQIRGSIFTLFCFLFLFHFPHVFFNCKFYLYGKGSALNVYGIVYSSSNNARSAMKLDVDRKTCGYRFLWLWIELVLNIDDNAMKSVPTYSQRRAFKAGSLKTTVDNNVAIVMWSRRRRGSERESLNGAL